MFDASGKPVDYRFLEINPAFEKQTGLRNAQGKRMRELAPNHEEHWFQIYGNIALTGEPLRFENEAKALGRHYEVCAYRVGGAGSRKVAILFNDITDRKTAQVKLQAQLERLSLLQQITRAIGERQDLPSIFQVVIRTLEDQPAHRFRLHLPARPGQQVAAGDLRGHAQRGTGHGIVHDRAGAWCPSTRTACLTACAASWSTSRMSARCRSRSRSGWRAVDCGRWWPRRSWWRARCSAS